MNQPDEESTCFVVARAQMTARYSFATEWHLRCLFLSISQLSGQEKESALSANQAYQGTCSLPTDGKKYNCSL